MLTVTSIITSGAVSGPGLEFRYAGQENTVAFQVAEIRAGDVPLPAGFSWKCRFNHAVAMDDPRVQFKAPNDAPALGVVRQVECSQDNWKTSASSTAGYPTGYSCLQHRRAAMIVRELRTAVVVELSSADKSDAPELP